VARDPAEARGTLGLEPHRPTLLVVGGSQGSLALNRAVTGLVREAAGDPGYQVLWSTGPRHLAGVEASLTETGGTSWVHATGYIDDMPSALAAADLAVSRAGAMATSEFLAWGLPAVLVPLPTAAADHQTRNAQALEEAGCAVHLPEADLDGPLLGRRVQELMADPEARARMSRSATERGRPEAAREIAEALATLLPSPGGGA